MYVVKYKRRNGGLTRKWSRRAAWSDVEVGGIQFMRPIQGGELVEVRRVIEGCHKQKIFP